MSGFQKFGFGVDDEGVGQKSNKFKAEQGKTYRISFCWWPLVDGKLNLDAETPEFIGCQRHYIEGVGYFVNNGPEFTALAGAPKQAIGTIIIVWPTDNKGELDKTRFSAGEADVVPWIFSADKYKQFKQTNSEFAVGLHDVKVTCTDTQFQKMNFTPCKESILRKIRESKDPKLAAKYEEILERVAILAEALPNEIARTLTLDQVREKMAGGSAGSSSPAKKPSTVTTEAVDDLVTSLLG